MSAASISRIVVRGVNWLGDAIMTLPALTRLRERFPEARITLVSREKLAAVLTGQPVIDEVLAIPNRQGVFATANAIRNTRADAALIFPNSMRTALEMWLARVPLRVGRDRGFRRLLLTHSVSVDSALFAMPKKSPTEIRSLLGNAGSSGIPAPTRRHHAHQYLELVKAFGGSGEACPPRLVISHEAVAQAAARFDLPPGGSSPVKLIGVNPGAEYGPAKRWPLDRFAEAVRQVAAVRPVDVLIFGGPADRPAANRLVSLLTEVPGKGIGFVRSVAGETSLTELAALARRCDVFLSNDSGPMHVAAAAGTRVVGVFGSTSPELTGPGLADERVHRLLRRPPACAPCFLRNCPVDTRCLSAIAPDQASEAVLELLEEGSPASSRSAVDAS